MYRNSRALSSTVGTSLSETAAEHKQGYQPHRSAWREHGQPVNSGIIAVDTTSRANIMSCATSVHERVSIAWYLINLE